MGFPQPTGSSKWKKRVMGVVQGIKAREVEELRKRAGWRGKTR